MQKKKKKILINFIYLYKFAKNFQVFLKKINVKNLTIKNENYEMKKIELKMFNTIFQHPKKNILR